jgi:putative membrane protein
VRGRSKVTFSNENDLISISDLPTLNATLNSLSVLLLTVGHLFIRRNNVKAHRAFMLSAFVSSTLFLISYLVYHYNHGATAFPGEGWIRAVYFTILISHTALAVAIVPMVLITLKRGLKGDFPRHRRLARWTYPIWMYVSVTGVVVYLLLYRLYPKV